MRSERSRLRAFLAAIVLVGIGLAAEAAVVIDVSLDFPTAVAVGQTGLPVSLTLTNANDVSDTDRILAIYLNGSCGEINTDAPSTCPNALLGLGVFSFSATATGGPGCSVTSFTITMPGLVDGNVEVLPPVSSDFLLAPGASCTISFTVNVAASPTVDADPPPSGLSGIQTFAQAAVTARAEGGGPQADFAMSSLVSFSTIAMTAGPGGALAPNGIPALQLTDAAQLQGLVKVGGVNPPGGTVTFRLFGPADPSCSLVPFQTQTVSLTNCTINPTTLLTDCVTSATFTANAAGNWHWNASYSGDADNPPLAAACSSNVVVAKATPTLSVSPNPTIGIVLQTPLREIVTLGGFAPTGEVEVNLYPPSDPTCVGAPVFSDTINVLGNGIYPSAFAPAALITVPGIYRWTTAYSGDVNNDPKVRDCSSAPVQVVNTTTLSIAKTPDGATISAGDTATFTITVTNTGAAEAVGFTLKDPLPAGALLTWQTSTPGCAISGIGAAQMLDCPDESLSAGASFVATVSAVTGVGACTTMTSSATAQAINAPAVSDGGSITCQVPVLAVSKTPDNGLVTSGDAATFTVSVINNGPGTASNVVISDPLPAGALLAWQTSSPGCAITGSGAGQALACNVASLGVGASFTANVSAVTAGGKCTTMNNTATAKGSNTLAASDTGKITCQEPVLAVSKTPDAGINAVGDLATFTVSVTNNGPGTASNVVISDPLPAGALLAWQTSSPGCAITGSGAGQALACNVASLGVGASFTANVSAVTAVGKCTTMNNTATAKGSNTSAASDTGTITCQEPVLSVSKTPDNGLVTSGDAATFTVSVINNGPGTASNVVISDALPAGALLAWQTSSPGCAITGSGAGQALACNVGSLGVGASFTANVSAVTAVGKCTTMNNTATAKGSNTSAASDNGKITCQQPVLSVSKTPDGAIVTAGDTVTFAITVTNNGPGTANGVTLGDPLPSGATLLWQTTTNGCTITGSGAAQALACSVASLAAGASFAATVSAVTDVGKCPTLNNTATATGANTAAASDGGSIVCQQPVLSVTKVPDNATITSGDTATFTITVINNGPGVAKNVSVSDPLPAGALLAWQTSSAGCAISGSGAAQALSCTIATLAAGASFTATVSAVTGAGKCPTMNNTVTAKAGNAAEASASAGIACQQPVLTISKTPDGAYVTAGETATFSIAVTNNGPGTTTNVAIADALPAGAQLAWQTTSAGCAITGSGATQELACTLASLTAGATFTAVVSAVTAVGNCPALNNTATGTAGNATAVSDGGSIICRTPPLLSKSTNPKTIGVGGTATLTYTLTSMPGNPVETVDFTDLLPSTLRVAAFKVGGTCPGAVAATTATPGARTITVVGLEVPPGPSSCTVTVVVTNAPGQTGTCPAPGPSGIISSSNILVDPATDACIIVKTFPSVLSVTTLATLAVGNGTGGIATDPLMRRAYVTSATPSGVSAVDLDTLAVVATIPLPGQPENLIANAATQRLYVVSATAPGAVFVVDTLANAVVATIAVGDHPQGIVADFQRREIYVSNRGSNSLSVIDTTTNAVVATIAAIGTEPGDPGLDTNLGKIFVASANDGTVTVIDTRARAVRKVLAVGTNPGSAVVSNATHKVYVNNVDDRTVSVIDATLDAVIATIAPIGAGSTFTTVSDVYRRGYLPNTDDGTLSIIDIDTDTLVKTLAVGTSPQQAAVDPEKGDVYVVNQGSNTVSVIDALTYEIVATFGVDADPWSVAVAPDRVLVLNENAEAPDTLTIAFDGGTQLDNAIATEFYSSAIDHYDHTANSLEVRLLNDGMAGDAYAQTGAYFRVWTAPAEGRVPMCAFSTAGYGAKDSSYYTPYSQECADLQRSADWYYEGTGYYVVIPDAAGQCPNSTSELYLLYNNQQGGAPNFRYTGSRATRDAMLAQGWTARGSGEQRVFACTPPLQGSPDRLAGSASAHVPHGGRRDGPSAPGLRRLR